MKSLFLFLFIMMSQSITIPKNPSLLEISTRPWLYSLSKKYGRSITTLSAVPDEEIEAFQAQGYHIVWLMGLWKVGPKGLEHDKTDPGLKRAYDVNLPGYAFL